MSEERLYKLYRPSDKGKARAYTQKNNRALPLQKIYRPTDKINARMSRAKMPENSAELKQFGSKAAQSVIQETQGLAKMFLKGFGN